MPKSIPFKPIQSARDLSALVCTQLEEAILSGAFGVDDRLPTEAELCEQFAVSRTAVREALQQLKSRGLVLSIPGSGNYICAFPFGELEKTLAFFGKLGGDPDLFRHFLELRVVLESECARQVSAQPSRLLQEKLRKCIGSMEASLDDLPAFVAHDVAFHLEIAQANPNPFFKALLSCLKPLHERYGLASYDSVEWIHKNLDDHRQIYTAISAGNPRRAETAMKTHLRESIAHYLTYLAQTKVESEKGEQRR